MKQYRFEVIGKEHLPQMAELFRSAFSGEPWNDDWSDTKLLEGYITDLAFNENSLCFGYFLGDELIAMSLGNVRRWWEGTNYNLDELCVSPEYQHQGVGGQFTELIAGELKKRGFGGIFLQTDIDKPAYSFYKSRGFTDLSKHVSLFRGLK